MKKNKVTAKSTSKTSKPIAKAAKPAGKINKPSAPIKKAAPVAAKSVKPAVKAKEIAKKAPVAAKVAAPKVVAPTVKAAAAKSAPAEKATVKAVSKELGHARVIEPLSWDAEKPKLNLTLTNKISRKDLKDKEDAEVKSYTIKARYTVGDRVMHADFGKGLVRDLIGDFKIRVAFRDFEKVLVHGINS